MNLYYILGGEDGRTPVPCEDLMEWGRWLDDRGKERVALDCPSKEVEVSTVFLGIDHNWLDGPPLLFETMVFGGPLDGEQDHYSTWTEAEAGHAAMVQRCKEAV